MADSSVSSLRHEFPALAIAINFVPHHIRSIYSDLFLLWLEARRATYANEAMIAAVRLAWWRDAFMNKNSQSVPLADRMLTLGNTYPTLLNTIIDILDQMITELAGGADKNKVLLIWHHAIARQLIIFANQNGGQNGGQDDGNNNVKDEASHILHVLDLTLLGETSLTIPTYTGKNNIFRLILWLTRDPARLSYPEQKPLLALNMAIAVLLRRI